MVAFAGKMLGRLKGARGTAPETGQRPLPEGPDGSPLVWMISDADVLPRPLAELARSLSAERPELRFVLTAGSAPGERTGPLPRSAVHSTVGYDTPADAADALDQWHPALIVLHDGLLPAELLAEAQRRGIATMVVDADGPPRTASLRHWLPGFTRSLVRTLDTVMVRNTATARAYRRAGASTSQIDEAGPLADTPGVLPYTAAERDAMAEQLKARPLWLAVGVPPDEEQTVIDAHRTAQRMAHRLLLVLIPSDPARGPALAAELSPHTSVALRSRGDDAQEDHQIYIADTDDEFGLWYVLASTTYLGGTLAGHGCAHDPLAPAAVGCAILHGPRRGQFAEAISRLRRAGGSRQVRDTQSLAAAVGELLAPDNAAVMAHRGWDVVSEGAEATARAVQIACAALDRAAGR